ncbi:MAG: saccharopine dehydrogenase NADP-binding domain-containing protein [Proteobacteria bacterium]|nr:saccharopine dehydrogenase NADP-binding domain-containing protein [Pseudomonadota bacterium]
MKTLILGGYGAVGIETARILLDKTELEVILAGRSRQKAEAAASELAEESCNPRVSGIAIDASNFTEIVNEFKKVDWVIICIPLSGIGSKIAEAAFEANVNYIDINANHQKQVYLQQKAEDIRKKELTFITEAGCVPGIPSLLVFHAFSKLGQLKSVEVGSMAREAKITYGSVYDMLVELGVSHRIYKDQNWIKAKLSDGRKIDLGPPFGTMNCYPFEFYELLTLPMEKLGIQNLGLYAPGVNPAIDSLFFIYMMTGLYKSKTALHLGARFATWAEKFTKPPFATLVQVNALAHNNNRILVRVSHSDAYQATAIPLAACIIQMLEMDLISQYGMHLMGHFLDSDEFLRKIAQLGMDVIVEDGIESITAVA